MCASLPHSRANHPPPRRARNVSEAEEDDLRRQLEAAVGGGGVDGQARRLCSPPLPPQRARAALLPRSHRLRCPSHFTLNSARCSFNYRSR